MTRELLSNAGEPSCLTRHSNIVRMSSQEEFSATFESSCTRSIRILNRKSMSSDREGYRLEGARQHCQVAAQVLSRTDPYPAG